VGCGTQLLKGGSIPSPFSLPAAAAAAAATAATAERPLSTITLPKPSTSAPSRPTATAQLTPIHSDSRVSRQARHPAELLTPPPPPYDNKRGPSRLAVVTGSRSPVVTVTVHQQRRRSPSPPLDRSPTHASKTAARHASDASIFMDPFRLPGAPQRLQYTRSPKLPPFPERTDANSSPLGAVHAAVPSVASMPSLPLSYYSPMGQHRRPVVPIAVSPGKRVGASAAAASASALTTLGLAAATAADAEVATIMSRGRGDHTVAAGHPRASSTEPFAPQQRSPAGVAAAWVPRRTFGQPMAAGGRSSEKLRAVPWVSAVQARALSRHEKHIEKQAARQSTMMFWAGLPQ
jgi:hypothetical protein